VTDAGGERRVEHVDRAGDVDLDVEARVLDGAADVDLGGQVVDDLGLDVGQQAGDGVAVGDGDLLQRGVAGDVLAAARGEVVQDGDLVAPGQQGVDEVGADEAGAAAAGSATPYCGFA